MDNKHFIWIIPLILTIGFIIGIITGIRIPKQIEIGFNQQTADIMNSTSNLLISYYKEKLENCRLNCTDNYYRKEYAKVMMVSNCKLNIEGGYLCNCED